MKQILITLTMSIMLLIFTGCSQQSSVNQTEMLATNQTETPATIGTQIENTTEEPLENITVGTPFVIDDIAEITLPSPTYANKVSRGNTSMEPNKSDSEILLIMPVSYKNLQADTIESFIYQIDEIPGFTPGTLTYDTKYKYNANVYVFEDIPPLSTGTIYYYYVIPKEIETSDKPLNLSVSINNKNYNLSIR